MKKILVVLLLVICAGTLAFADQAQLTLVSTPYSVNGNGTGPYKVDVTPLPSGSTTQPWLVCFSDENLINNNDTWTANVYTIADVPVPTYGTITSIDQFKEIAYLASLLIANPSTSQANADLQVAVWLAAGLYTKTPTQGALDDLAMAELAVQNGYQAYGAVFYIPVDGTPGVNGSQPMVGFVPEPGSLALLGTGILGAAGAIRRRFMI